MKALKILIKLFMVIPFIAQAHVIQPQKTTAGGIAVIDLMINSQEKKPVVKYKNKRVLTIQSENKWYAIVGVSLKNKSKEDVINLESPIKKDIKFKINKKSYPVEKLTISNNRLVSPNNEDMKRIRKEMKLFKSAIGHWSDDTPRTIQLDKPTKGRFSSPFGIRRIMNGVEKSPHSGLDIAAPTGAEIKAPLSGKVILTGDMYFAGNMVMLDHGQGFKTSYSHLSEVKVKKGDTVNAGEVIGLVGMTGRVTGPHLHWMVYLNEEKVDPKLFLDINTNSKG